MADLHDDDHLFEDMSPESPGTIGRNIVRRLGLASQVAEAIRSPNNNTDTDENSVFNILRIVSMRPQMLMKIKYLNGLMYPQTLTKFQHLMS